MSGNKMMQHRLLNVTAQLQVHNREAVVLLSSSIIAARWGLFHVKHGNKESFLKAKCSQWQQEIV